MGGPTEAAPQRVLGRQSPPRRKRCAARAQGRASGRPRPTADSPGSEVPRGARGPGPVLEFDKSGSVQRRGRAAPGGGHPRPRVAPQGDRGPTLASFNPDAEWAPDTPASKLRPSMYPKTSAGNRSTPLSPTPESPTVDNPAWKDHSCVSWMRRVPLAIKESWCATVPCAEDGKRVCKELGQ